MGVVSCGTTMLDQGVFQNIGAVTWDTTAKTSGFTAVSGNGYFVNTTSASITVTLPSSPSAGDIVGIKDYANTADTNKIVIGRNGSKIQGQTDDFDLVKEGGSVLLVYVDGTQGWKVTSASQANDITNAEYIVATGGTVTTCGNFKIHTFTGPGTFSVSSVGNPVGSDTVDYLVIAGGASGGAHGGGGGGAGGYRESSGAASGCYTVSPLGSGVSALPVSASPGSYPITVGGGGSGSPNTCGTNGSNSSFSTITSTGGGGGGGGGTPPKSGKTGGSGGGSGGQPTTSGAAGNTPPVSPPQGNPGGATAPPFRNGGGGGATAAGTDGSGSVAGPGGDGATSAINGTPTTRAGGGGGSVQGPGTNGSGGPGGGGDATGSNPTPAATANTGGGGGGVHNAGSNVGGSGGSGIVIIRYKFQ